MRRRAAEAAKMLRARFEAFFSEPSYKHAAEVAAERLAAVDRVLRHEGSEIERAWNGADASSLRLHIALYILACIRHRDPTSSFSYAADVCCFPRQEEAADDNRYEWGTSFQIYRVVVRDPRTYLDVIRALQLHKGLMATEVVDSAAFGLSWEWGSCAYIRKAYDAPRLDAKKSKKVKVRNNNNAALEDFAWEAFLTPANDPTLPLLGSNFVLERRLVVTTVERREKMYGRLKGALLASIKWLNVLPAHPYMQAMRLSTSEEPTGMVRLYKFMFYVCLENCSLNTPGVGAVLHRDTISRRPLVFEVIDSQAFARTVMLMFAPPPPPPLATDSLEYSKMDRTCLEPIVLTDASEATKRMIAESSDAEAEPPESDNRLTRLREQGHDVEGYSLAEILTAELYPNAPAVVRLGAGGLSRFKLMHLSLYTPNYHMYLGKTELD